MATLVIAKAFVFSAAGMYLETQYGDFGASLVFPALPKYFGLAMFVNIVMSSLYVTMILGMGIGSYRKQYKEKAIKDGEERAEERYSYPNLYVDGPSQNAYLFNCAQRSHQQCLETYSQFLLCSVLAALKFPLFTTFTGLFWLYARNTWANGYCVAPDKRYGHWASFGIWYGLLFTFITAGASCLSLLGVF
jgi:glutathione S-transferase